MRKWILPFLVSAILAALRVGGEKSEAFQAIAHLWVGGLVAVWFGWQSRPARFLVITLSLIETACFLDTHPLSALIAGL